MKEYLEEKLKESQALVDFWHNKYLMTGNNKHGAEYKYYDGKESAYYDALEQLQILEKKGI